MRRPPHQLVPNIDDVLGSLLVAPPSKGVKRDYEIICGSLDAVQQLPALRERLEPRLPDEMAVRTGSRNNSLFDFCMRNARGAFDVGDLLELAIAKNETYRPPMGLAEVLKTVRSAWRYQERGENRFGAKGAWISDAAITDLVHDPELFTLVGCLKSQEGPDDDSGLRSGWEAY